MTQTIKIRNEPAQHIGVANSAPCPEMNIVTKEITENGRYEARTEGATGFDPVIVNVPSREEIGYENGYNDGYGKGSTDGYADALAKRTELEVTANGEYIPDGESTGFSKVNVNIPSGAEIEDGLISGTLSGAYRNDRVTKVRENAFARLSKVTSIDLPNVTSIPSNCVNYCDKLAKINMPLVTSVPSQGIHSCYGLQYVSIPSVTKINQRGFSYCTVLKAVVLGGTSVCTLANTNGFNACYHILGTVDSIDNPEGLKDGYIYVPDNLVEQYKVATNWSTYASQIKPISELGE